MIKLEECSIRLRDCRHRAGLSQKQAAHRAKIGAKSISSWECGRAIRSLTVAKLLVLLKAYGVSGEMFFSDSLEEWW